MRVILADNQFLTSEGFSSFLKTRPDYELCDVITEASHLMPAVIRGRPDLLVVDYNLDDFVTIDDLEILAREKSSVNMLVLSSDNDKSKIMKVLQLGVTGYVTKESSREELSRAIELTGRGEKYFCQKILNILVAGQRANEPSSTETSALTEREAEILGLIAKGRSSQQIADSLHLSPHTIQSHRKSIIRKLQIKSPTEFVIHALDLGLMRLR